MAAILSENRLKQALVRRVAQPGLWLTLGSSYAVETLSGAGFPWMLVDMEHSCIESKDVVDLLRAAESGVSEIVVRIPWRDPVLMKRLLDAGVRSFMVPYVQDADEARQIVAATRYPPRGTRGVNGTMRANRHGRSRKDYFDTYLENTCVVVQVETPEAIANIPAIGAVDGVDAIFIGPNDLAANMGHFGDPGAPRVQAMVEVARAAIALTGKAAGILEYDTEKAKRLLAAGFSMVAVASDTGMLVHRGNELLGAFR